MSMSLRERFREVDKIPSPWDERAEVATHQSGSVPDRKSRGLLVAASAATAAVALALTLVVLARDAERLGDASWLTDNEQASCVEAYSPRTLQERSYAFEGAITDVQAPANPDSPDPTATATTVTFDVVRWFWGGTGANTSRRTYAMASSAGEIDGSIGARLLVSGDEDFLWACGFTQPVTPQGTAEYEAAGLRRAGA
jgi:hypothetical protein